MTEIQPVGAVPIDFDKARARFPRGRRGICFLGCDGTPDAIVARFDRPDLEEVFLHLAAAKSELHDQQTDHAV